MPSTITYRPRVRFTAGDAMFLPGQEAASQSFALYEPLTLSSGLVARIIAAGAGSDLTSATPIVGVATQPASGVTSAEVTLYRPDNIELLMPVNHATPASAVTAITQVGTAYVLEHTSEGNFTVAIDTTTSPVVEVTEIAKDYEPGEQYGLVWVRFADAAKMVGG